MKLNMEQRRIVELEPGGPMLVKGVTGSGNEYLPLISFDHVAPAPFKTTVLAMWHKGALLSIENIISFHRTIVFRY